MSFVGIDVGGTFTDLCVFDPETGAVNIAKTLTTADDLSEGVLKGLHELPLTAPEAVRLLHHGTTLVTNALIERKGVRVGLLTTAGFRDVLEIMRTDRERLYDLQWRRPEPFVPRQLRREVQERIGPFGDVLTPLDEQSAVDSAAALVADGCEAIAVVLLHAYVDDAHERRVGELIRERHPGVAVYLSSAVDPQYREYERSSTTVLTAFVGPVVEKYFLRLRTRLEGDGFDSSRLGIMQSNGGTMKADRAHERAGYMFLSGPAAGVVGAVEFARLSGFDRIITMDMGGTSCDVASAREGRFLLQTDREVEFQIPLRIPSLDVVTIGAGGGSIAYVDEGGALHVGPESAGASPGPASYGMGGTRPTVTDANVVLRRLRDGPLAAGTVIESAAAEEAIRVHVAERLGLSVADAALGILEIATVKMANAIREVSVARGYDPRDFVLVPSGGAGPLHAGYVARELGIPKILVPRTPGILSAIGCMLSDVRFDYMRSILEPLDASTLAAMQGAVSDLRADGDALLETDGFAAEARDFIVTCDMRYVGQVHEVNVDLPASLDDATVDGVADRFHAAHAALYGAPFPGHRIEVVNLRLAAIGRTTKPTWQRSVARRESSAAPEPYEVREVLFKQGEHECPAYMRDTLLYGDVLVGPALVDSIDSTVLVLPGSTARVDAYEALLIEEDDR